MSHRDSGLVNIGVFCTLLMQGCVSSNPCKLGDMQAECWAREERSAMGEIVSLADTRFSSRTATLGVWRPLDYARATHAGVYFLEPYTPDKTPVLFIHGISGSPAQFLYLLERLDGGRFQPWVYAYPSGAHLDVVAAHLERTLAMLQSRYRFGALAIVAHSMGGLVARDFILRHARTPDATPVPLFVSLSTPWDGHAAAGVGVKHSPVVVDAWRDLVPGSAYLRDLFATTLPEATHHWLIFTFNRRKGSFGESSDQKVSVASQLHTLAQREATRVLGFDDTHDGVLRDAAVATLLDELLVSTFAPQPDQNDAVANIRAPP